LQEQQHHEQQPAGQQLNNTACATTAISSSGAAVKTAATQPAPLMLDVHAEPHTQEHGDEAQQSVEQQPQQQQREVLQQLLSDSYLRGWEGEGSQGTQLLPTVALFRPLACLTQVRPIGCAIVGCVWHILPCSLRELCMWHACPLPAEAPF
jgi:hypothetical protein